MDIYGDDIDTILDSADDPLNMNAILDDRDDDADADDDENARNDNSDTEAGSQQAPVKVEPKVRRVHNPQLRLNAERLLCDRGVHTLEQNFAGVRFGGKGHEPADLDMLMKRIEHWAHRLYPPAKFDDFIATAERLGRKKQIQRHMYNYRQGLLEPTSTGSDPADEGASDDERPEAGADAPIDELDDLIGQQIEKYRTAPRTPGGQNLADSSAAFNALRNQTGGGYAQTPSFVGRAPIGQSTPVLNSTLDDDIRPLPATPARLNAEQMARIAENRRLAQARLRAKREAAAAAAAESAPSYRPDTSTVPEEDEDM